MNHKRTLTAESVTEEHPDKLCDLIADSILDECLKKDKNARVACEVMATAGKITVAGEITVSEMPDLPAIVCKTVRNVGYTSDYEVEILIHDQSTDIADAVDGAAYSKNCSGTPHFSPGDLSSGNPPALENCSGTGCLGHYTSNRVSATDLGAGDQGIVYGYAVNETDEMLPLPVVLANKLTMCLSFVRKMGLIQGLLPDGKSQVSVEYDGKTPVRIAAIVISCQHDEDKDMEQLRREVLKLVIEPALAEFPPDDETEILINPSGRFVLGGFEADTGLTGRKLMADTYGGLALHGGGALSGKDGTKVDRSGAYMARYVAKNVVAAGLADECTVSIVYAIGRSEPLAVSVDTHGTGIYSDHMIAVAIKAVFDFRPTAMIRTLQLKRPIFADACCYGHFTKQSMPWEQTDKADELRQLYALLSAPTGVMQ